ncbi:MAG: hypothetical protein HOW73_37915 [Polyangiaceae bacterium]|nr:hypothetical protein [Polyangiaceae bacterium]
MEKPTTFSEDPRAHHPADAQTPSPDRVILVYDGDSGIQAMLLDVVKKAVGREDCALCEITYSPLGKRSGWSRCAAGLGVPVTEIHRDQVPPEWGIARTELPCVLGQVQEQRPFVLVARDEIRACRGSVQALEAKLHKALSPSKRGDG